MSKTLIIKTGATGDVIRTTVLLHIIEGEVYWVTSPYNEPLLPPHVHRIIFDAQHSHLPADILTTKFTRVINLEEDIKTARLAGNLQTKSLIGTYCDKELLKYTPQSAEWFDMSLISLHGKKSADELKRKNKYSYQEILYRMLGKEFKGEKYLLHNLPLANNGSKKIIGVEKNAGTRWPNKAWSGYDELVQILKSDGYEAIEFRRRNNIHDYITDISNCSFVITGDTLAMHISLACNIPCIAIFTCTSPHEIYDYRILTKIVSSKLYDFFYDTSYDPRASGAVAVEEVVETFRRVKPF